MIYLSIPCKHLVSFIIFSILTMQIPGLIHDLFICTMQTPGLIHDLFICTIQTHDLIHDFLI